MPRQRQGAIVAEPAWRSGRGSWYDFTGIRFCNAADFAGGIL